MAFDGITIANLRRDFSDRLVGGRIYKIAQPEADELLLTIKANGTQYRLLLSADASLPLMYFTDANKPSPMVAPNFCMLLRKHLQSARIIEIVQPQMERIVRMKLEHLNELGDVCRKFLIVELMGKHSNIIFCNEEGMIIDSIKHISGAVSSVREVLPGRDYFIPQTQEKKNPLEVDESVFRNSLKAMAAPVYKTLYLSYTGLSPLIANELCYRAQVDAAKPSQALEQEEGFRLYQVFSEAMNQVREGIFCPNMIYENGVPKEYASLPLTSYDEENKVEMEDISKLLETYYKEKNVSIRIRQKSVDLRKIVQTALERNIKKLDLQRKQMEDTQKKETYRVYGELLNTYGYEAKEGDKVLEALNYYTNEMVKIPLEEGFTPKENAQKYFEKYNKMKRTFEALEKLTCEVEEEIRHLESVMTALDIALVEPDLVQIKEELMQSGYIKRRGGGKKEKITSKPFHYQSASGYDIYVGKNNLQNEDLTFQVANGNDWWFHAKGIPGSHVIVKTNGEELPDSVFEEAGRLAAHYSKARGQDKVEIDYIQRKHVKKPSGAKPGFVVYYTNYSLMIDSNITKIQHISD